MKKYKFFYKHKDSKKWNMLYFVLNRKKISEKDKVYLFLIELYDVHGKFITCKQTSYGNLINDEIDTETINFLLSNISADSPVYFDSRFNVCEYSNKLNAFIADDNGEIIDIIKL